MQDLGIRVLFEGNNLLRLFNGLLLVVELSAIAVFCSIVLGILMGALMTLKNPLVTLLTRFYLEFIRIMPQLVLLFIVYFGLTRLFGIDLSGFTSALIVFVLWGTAEMGDLVRGTLIAIPQHQYDSGAAIGLTKPQIFRYIIVPQTLRRLIPLAMNLTTRMIKTTSLIVLIGVVEMMKTGQQIIEANRYTAPSAALWIYGTIFILYFILCYPVSLAAQALEERWKN